MKSILHLIFLFVISVVNAQPETPVRQFLDSPVCEDLGNGDFRQLESIQLFEVGKDSAVFQFYVNYTGSKIQPIGQLTAGYCCCGANQGEEVISKDTEYCRDTIAQLGHSLALESYGFLPVHYNTTGWEPASLASDTLAHDAYLVGFVGTDSLILQYCGSIEIPNGALEDGKHYKLQIDGTIADTAASNCYAPVGHVHGGNIFTLSPAPVMVFCSNGNSNVQVDYISSVTFNNGNLEFLSEGNAFEGLVPINVNSDDADWYDITTNAPPTDINRNIYTNGDVGIGTNAQEFYGLAISRTNASMLKLKNTNFNAATTRFEGPSFAYEMGLANLNFFEVRNTNNFTTPFRIHPSASNLALRINNSNLGFSDYPNTRSDIGASAQHIGSSGGIVPGNYLYTGIGGTLFSVPIGTMPLQPYTTTATLDGQLDYTVTTSVNQTLPAGFPGKYLFIKNIDQNNPILISATAPQLVDGLASVEIDIGHTRVLQSTGNSWITVLYTANIGSSGSSTFSSFFIADKLNSLEVTGSSVVNFLEGNLIQPDVTSSINPLEVKYYLGGVATGNTTMDMNGFGFNLIGLGSFNVGIPAIYTDKIRKNNTISPATLSGVIDDWNPPGLDSCNRIKLNISSASNLTGIEAQEDGTEYLLINHTGTSITLIADNPTSTSEPENRFIAGSNYILISGRSVYIQYVETDSRWTIIGN